MTRSARIVVNTFASYARLAIAAAAGFITLPIVLRTLGTTDFGVFSVIAGALSILLFVNGALTGGAQRHIAYALGSGGIEEASDWFITSLVIHVCLAIGMLFAALFSSHWVIYRLLSLPPSRLGAAMWTYRAVVVMLVCTIVSTPYQALLIAKESIFALSAMAMASSLFLAGGVLLLNFLPGDHLIWYSGIYVVSDVFLFVGPVLFCSIHYSECRRLSSNAVTSKKFRELLGFSSANLLGTLAVQIRYQGPAILLNRFVGTAANAAAGIAMQVNGFASSVSTALLSATSPPIVKAEGAGKRAEMLYLSNLANKYSFLLLWLLVGPLLFELKYCLGLWLHQMPTSTAIFSTALLVALLLDMLTAGFTAAVQAGGRIVLYQGVIGLLLCISVPAAYLLLRLHLPASSALWTLVGSSALAGGGRLWFLCHRLGLKQPEWVNNVLRPCLVTFIACCLVMGLIEISVRPGLLRLLALYLLNCGVAVVAAWEFATSDRERSLKRRYVSELQQQAFSRGRWVLALAARRL